LKENLFRAGYRNVDIAKDGEDAFLKISRNHPDVAIVILIRHCGDENEGGRYVLAEVQRPRVPQNADAVQLCQPDIGF